MSYLFFFLEGVFLISCFQIISQHLKTGAFQIPNLIWGFRYWNQILALLLFELLYQAFYSITYLAPINEFIVSGGLWIGYLDSFLHMFPVVVSYLYFALLGYDPSRIKSLLRMLFRPKGIGLFLLLWIVFSLLNELPLYLVLENIFESITKPWTNLSWITKGGLGSFWLYYLMDYLVIVLRCIVIYLVVRAIMYKVEKDS